MINLRGTMAHTHRHELIHSLKSSFETEGALQEAAGIVLPSLMGLAVQATFPSSNG